MRPTVVLVTLLVLSGCSTFSPAAPGWGPSEESAAQAADSTPSLVADSEADADSRRLLTRADLRRALADDGADPDEYDLTLFYVDADGMWHHADPDGTVGPPAPTGDVVPGIFVDDPPGTPAPERAELAASERPTYVWKVTKTTGTPTTMVVDATSGETLGVWTVPARGRAPPTTA
jgi:hypothetical protein